MGWITYVPFSKSDPSKRSSGDTVFPQIEDDVSELDQLRNEPGAVVAKRQHDGSTARTTTTTKESVEEVAAVPEPGPNPNANILPDLERQLEVATPLISTTTTTSTSATTTTATSKEEGERSQLEEPKTQIKTVVEPTAHAKVSGHPQSPIKNRPLGRLVKSEILFCKIQVYIYETTQKPTGILRGGSSSFWPKSRGATNDHDHNHIHHDHDYDGSSSG